MDRKQAVPRPASRRALRGAETWRLQNVGGVPTAYAASADASP